MLSPMIGEYVYLVWVQCRSCQITSVVLVMQFASIGC